jgi:transcriptional regulator with XRE-family HTH domain
MFKQLRERTGYTVEHVAKQIGIKKNTLYKIEEFHSIPSASILLKMKDIYNCEYEEVLNAYKFAKGVHNERKAKRRN